MQNYWMPTNSLRRLFWPSTSSSPDLNPLDYHIWGTMLEKYHKLQPKHKTTDELKVALQTTWEEMPWEHVNKVVAIFTKCLTAYMAVAANRLSSPVHKIVPPALSDFLDWSSGPPLDTSATKFRLQFVSHGHYWAVLTPLNRDVILPSVIAFQCKLLTNRYTSVQREHVVCCLYVGQPIVIMDRLHLHQVSISIPDWRRLAIANRLCDCCIRLKSQS